MIKYTRIILLLLLTLPVTGQFFPPTPKNEGKKAVYNCYYITLNNDTIKATILFSDIIRLQHRLEIIQTDGTIKTYYPGEIKGFELTNTDSLTFLTNQSETNNQEFKLIKQHEYINMTIHYNSPIFELPVYNNPSPMYFESLAINDTAHLFVNVKYGVANNLKYLNYYYSYHPHYRGGHGIHLNEFRLAAIQFYKKDNTLLDQSTCNYIRKGMVEFSQLVADDTLLTTLIRRNELIEYNDPANAQQLNVKMVVDAYNQWWANNKRDTSLALKGILDADKYYKQKKSTFWGVTISTAAFFLPGVITSITVNSFPPKEKNLNIPANCPYQNNADYLTGYKMRARAKKCKASDNGFKVGLAALVVEALVLAAL